MHGIEIAAKLVRGEYTSELQQIAESQKTISTRRLRLLLRDLHSKHCMIARKIKELHAKVKEPRPTLTELLNDYPINTGMIRYRSPNGKIVDWPIGARSGVDNETTLRSHLSRWKPDCKFIEGQVKQKSAKQKQGAKDD